VPPEHKITFLNRLVESEPDNLDAKYQLAKNLIAAQQIEVGVQILEGILTEDPGHISAYHYI